MRHNSAQQYKYVSIDKINKERPADVQASPGAKSTALASSDASKARKSLIKNIMDQQRGREFKDPRATSAD